MSILRDKEKYGTSYDVETDGYEFFDIQNKQPFLHFSINDIKDLENEEETLLNLK